MITEQFMSATKIVKSISSRPIYGKLRAQLGSNHLIVADGEGAQAVLELCRTVDTFFLASCHVIFIASPSDEQYVKRLQQLSLSQLHIAASYQSIQSRLREVLHNARIGFQLYLTGTESLMGQSMIEASRVGIAHNMIQTEHRGSTARRMQCVHCKGITENVTHDPFQCAHCDLHLFVRDHYSRRIAAFQGVRVDAEDPGNIPTPVERFK